MDSSSPKPHESPIMAQAVDSAGRTVSPPPPRRRGPGLLTVLFIVLLCVILGGSLLMNVALLASQSAGDPADRLIESRVLTDLHPGGKDKVAIIHIEGTILSSDGYIARQIRRAKRDENVKAVVLRINSPGGSVTASDHLYYRLNKLAEEEDMPIVVSMGGLAASGGYYLAMAVGHTPNSIYAEPATWTGSIGVIIPHFNVAGLMENHGIEEDSVVSHHLKGMGGVSNAMTTEEEAIFQELVNQSFERFKSIVRDGRREFADKPELLEEVATGQIFTADQAVENGLVDKIGFIEEAVARAIKLADLDPKEVSIISYSQQPSLSDVLFASAPRPSGFNLESVLDMAAPRAYYLYGRAPVMLGR